MRHPSPQMESLCEVKIVLSRFTEAGSELRPSQWPLYVKSLEVSEGRARGTKRRLSRRSRPSVYGLWIVMA